jgi:hypothetical protein
MDAARDLHPDEDDDFYFSDQDYDEGFAGKEEIPEDLLLERSFEDATRYIRSKQDFDPEDADDFVETYKESACIDSQGGNLLHAIIDMVKHNEEITPDGMESLVLKLIWKYPALLNGQNKERQNPIAMAIRSSKEECLQLIDYMVSACNGEPPSEEHIRSLDEALSSIQPHAGESCLHMAFKEHFVSDKTLRMLIENASDKALAIKDKTGKTPMHHAVSFPTLLDERAKLLDLFIERDLKTKQQHPTFLDLDDENGRSVYAKHQYDRMIVENRFNKEKAEKLLADRGKKEAGRAATIQADAQLPTVERPPMHRRPGPSQATMAEQTRLKPASNETGRNGAAIDDKVKDREELRKRRKDEEKRKMAVFLSGAANPYPRVKGNDEGDFVRPQGSGSRLQEQVQEPAPNTGIRRTNTGVAGRTAAKGEDQEPVAKPVPALAATKSRPPPSRSRGTSKKIQSASMPWRRKLSDDFLLKLKLHYMRTRSAEMAMHFIYGNNMNDIQISFDYDSLPKAMIWNEFEKRFGADSKSGFRFDSVLQYVAFPHVEVQRIGRLADKERERAESHPSLGREDIKYFFAWLYKKGVRHIIRVTVEDSPNSSGKVHSDKAIQESLEKFVVEILDWRKVDLDPETILHISSKVETKVSSGVNDDKTEMVQMPQRRLRELWLRWSGNNTALRAWSEREGLAMLPDLTRIHVVGPPPNKMYDGPDWTSNKMREFQTRLNSHRRLAATRDQTGVDPEDGGNPNVEKGVGVVSHVQVITRSYADEQRSTASRHSPHLTMSEGFDKGVDSHQWLQSTARFASEMDHLWKQTIAKFLQSGRNQTEPRGIEKDVVIALIDDGVDIFDSSLSDQILQGKSFDFHDGKVQPPYSSAMGHGTVMASMILRVCPMAKVYPIRLKTFDTANGKNRNIDAKYAAQAIQAALDRKATIISMSWTLPFDPGQGVDSGPQKRLRSVLEQAVKEKVLMFCSTPDKGKFLTTDYPSGPWRNDKKFFRIGAANADGTVFQWTPEDAITYVLPGVDVVKEQAASSSSRFDVSHYTHEEQLREPTKRLISFKYETGSSVATALAAGLAAMIIYCIKATILIRKTSNQSKSEIPIPDDGADRIAEDPIHMMNAFAALGNVTSNGFIQVWDQLDGVADALRVLRSVPSEAAGLEQTEKFVKFGTDLWNAKYRK